MLKYKTVAGPANLVINPYKEIDKVVRAYAEIIERETVGGWELDSIQTIPVTGKAGTFGPATIININMLIFRREE